MIIGSNNNNNNNLIEYRTRTLSLQSRGIVFKIMRG